MSKRTTGFYLDEANIKWLEEQGKREGRSASNFLDRLIESIRNEVGDAKD